MHHDSWSWQKVLVTRSSVRSYLLPRLAVAPNLTDDACHQQCWYPRPKRKDPCGKQRSLWSHPHIHATSVTVAKWRACSYLSRLPSTPNYVVTHGSTRLPLGFARGFSILLAGDCDRSRPLWTTPKRRFITTHSNVSPNPPALRNLYYRRLKHGSRSGCGNSRAWRNRSVSAGQLRRRQLPVL